MKTNQPVALLMALLFVSVACTTVFSYLYVRSVGQLQNLQVQRMGVGLQLNRFQSLINDTIEYSKRNPEILPLLQSFERKPDAVTAPAISKPAK
jgi:hypothetical protein